MRNNFPIRYHTAQSALSSSNYQTIRLSDYQTLCLFHFIKQGGAHMRSTPYEKLFLGRQIFHHPAHGGRDAALQFRSTQHHTILTISKQNAFRRE